MAVSKSSGISILYHDTTTGNWGHSITSRLSDVMEPVQTIMLTDIIIREGLKKIHLIKFNCEGAEFEILLSTSKEMLQRIDTMIILYHEDLVEGADYKMLIKHLSAMGFRHLFRNDIPCYQQNNTGNKKPPFNAG